MPLRSFGALSLPSLVFVTVLSETLRGVIGPARQFSPGQMYHPIVYWAIIGAVLPVPFYLLARRWPNSWLRYVNIPVMLTGAAFIPPATGFNYASWCVHS